MAKRVARSEDLFLLIPLLFSNEISFPQRSTDPLSFFSVSFLPCGVGLATCGAWLVAPG